MKRNWILDLAEGRTNRIYYRFDMDVRERASLRLTSGFELNNCKERNVIVLVRYDQELPTPPGAQEAASAVGQPLGQGGGGGRCGQKMVA